MACGMRSVLKPIFTQNEGILKKVAHITGEQGDRPESARLAHILGVDVEDYFQVEAFAGQVARESWDRWPSRVVGNTQRLLDLFDRRSEERRVGKECRSR